MEERNHKVLLLKQPHGDSKKDSAKKEKESANRFSFDIDVGNLSKSNP